MSTAEETAHECRLSLRHEVLVSRVEGNLRTPTTAGMTVARWHWDFFEGTDCSRGRLLYLLRHSAAF
jgi:hypothetical protein